MSHNNFPSFWMPAIALLGTFAQLASAADTTKQPPAGDLRVGAFAMDVTPTQFPVIVNGMFEERTADRDVDPLFARAFVFDDGRTRLAITVIDSCMLPRELLDAAKEEASRLTGIPVDHMLISATHTHSAPSSMGCLGSRPDPNYPAFLIPKIARAIEKANEKLQPAQIGFAKVHAPNYTYCRRYIRRSDRVFKDPFGDLTVRANMHPGFLSPDAIGPSGPVDDELSVLAMQTADGKPLGVLANFSMHYVSSPMLSSDYFGRFAEHLGKSLEGSDGSSSCIVSMSQGTSGDLASMNYNAEANNREYDSYAKDLATLAYDAYRGIKFQRHAPLAIKEAKLTLERRTPDARRLAWAKGIAEKIGDRRPKGQAEVYALEQLELVAEPKRELKLQALRIGDVAIAAIPNEVFALTGLKLKMQSPLPNTFNIELANGADGYIPPPEQHKLGGYTTWAARTAGLEVEAEPKIVGTLLPLLEEVVGKPRRALPDVGGAYAAAVLKSKPRAYWRLTEMSGNTAADSSGNHLDARYEGDMAFYLPGPPGKGMSANGQSSRAAHFVGGSVRAEIPNLAKNYSVEFWFWNGLPNDARLITASLCRCAFQNGVPHSGDHLTIMGGKSGAGHLKLANGLTLEDAIFLHGATPSQAKTWNHVAFVREGADVRTYLNGLADGGLAATVPRDLRDAGDQWCFGGNKIPSSGLEGKMCDIAVFDRALTRDEVANHYSAAGVAPSNK